MFLFLQSLIGHAYALGLGDTLDEVGARVPNQSSFCFSESCILGILHGATNDILGSKIIFMLGVIFVTVAGVRLTTKSDEGELTNARRSILMVFVGVILAAAHQVLYDAAVAVEGGAGAHELCSLLLDIVASFEGLAGIIAIIAVAVTGIRVLASFGEEDAVAAMRKSVIAVLFGLFLLINKDIVFPAIGLGQCSVFGGATPVAVIAKIISILATLLGYLQVLAVLIVVILGFMMIITFGNEEYFSKLKGYLFRLLIGFIILSMVRYLLYIFL